MNAALLFPGQGVQTRDMWSLVENLESGRGVIDRARSLIGARPMQRLLTSDDTRLMQTNATQPAVFLCSLGLYEAARSAWSASDDAPRVTLVAGHSLGEYTAAVASGALSFDDGLELVTLRGKVMEATRRHVRGGMTALMGVSVRDARDMCREVRRSSGALVTIAGVNGPQQVVVGGTERGLELVEAEARRRAARAVRLNISIPAHTPLMAAASRAMRDALDRVRFSTPSVPLVSAVSGAILSSGEDVRRALQRQMLRPVHWPRVVAALEASQAVPWDVGPGEVIAGITSRFGLRVQSLWRWLQDRAADLQEAVPAVVRP